MDLTLIKYPLGKFILNPNPSEAELGEWKKNLDEYPQVLNKILENITTSDELLQYRIGSWSIRQLVHHIADVNMNTFIRFKLAMTEEFPIIKPYDEQLFSELADVQDVSLHESLLIIKGIHSRWTRLIDSVEGNEWERGYIHPEDNTKYSLKNILCKTIWHQNHHLEHIRLALKHKISNT